MHERTAFMRARYLKVTSSCYSSKVPWHLPTIPPTLLRQQGLSSSTRAEPPQLLLHLHELVPSRLLLFLLVTISYLDGLSSPVRTVSRLFALGQVTSFERRLTDAPNAEARPVEPTLGSCMRQFGNVSGIIAYNHGHHVIKYPYLLRELDLVPGHIKHSISDCR